MKILLAQIKLKTADFDFNKKNIFSEIGSSNFICYEYVY